MDCMCHHADLSPSHCSMGTQIAQRESCIGHCNKAEAGQVPLRYAMRRGAGSYLAPERACRLAASRVSLDMSSCRRDWLFSSLRMSSAEDRPLRPRLLSG